MAITEVRRKRGKAAVRVNKRKIVVELIETEQIHNHRLLAEYFAKKFNERGRKNETN